MLNGQFWKKIILFCVLPSIVLSVVITSLLPFVKIHYVKETIWKNGILYGTDELNGNVRIFTCGANGENSWIDTIYSANDNDSSFYGVEEIRILDNNICAILLKAEDIIESQKYIYITYDLKKRRLIDTKNIDIEKNLDVYKEKSFGTYTWYITNEGSVWQKDNNGNESPIFINSGTMISRENTAYTFGNDGLYFYNIETDEFYIIRYDSQILEKTENILFNKNISSYGNLNSVKEMEDGTWTASFYTNDGKLLPMVVGKSLNPIEKLSFPIEVTVLIFVAIASFIFSVISAVTFLVKRFSKTFPTELKIICLSIPILVISCFVVKVSIEKLLEDDVESRAFSQIYYTANSIYNNIIEEDNYTVGKTVNVYENIQNAKNYDVIYNKNGNVVGNFDGIVGNISVFGYDGNKLFNADIKSLFCAPVTLLDYQNEYEILNQAIEFKSPVKGTINSYIMGKCLALYYPILQDNNVSGIIRVLYPEKYIKNDIIENQTNLIYNIFIFLASIITFLAIISFFLICPLNKIRYALSDFSAGIDFIKKPKQGNGSEIKEMTNLIYNMIANVDEHLNNVDELKRSYEPYIPQKLISIFGKNDIRDISPEDETIIDNAVIVVIDAINFSDAVSKAGVQEMFHFVNNVLERLTACVEEENGIVIQFTDIGIYAFFKNEPNKALKAAINVQKSLQELPKNLAGEKVTFGAGMIFGNIKVGVIGEEERMEIRAVSPEMSFARYLQRISGMYNLGILIDETVEGIIKNFKEKSDVRYIGRVGFDIEGIYYRDIYEVFGGQNQDIVRLKKITKKDFEDGIEFFQSEKYDEAKECFIRVLRKNKDDLAAGRYLKLCSDKIYDKEKGMIFFEQY